MSVKVTKRTTWQAMCNECRSLSRWWNTIDEAIEELNGHHCEAVE